MATKVRLQRRTRIVPLLAQLGASGNIQISVGGGAATSVTLSGPASGTTGAPSANFSVAVNGSVTGTVTVTPSDNSGGGTFAPTSVGLTTGSPSATFTYTAATDGQKSVSITNTLGLTNSGSPISYTASEATGSADFITRRSGANVIAWQGFDFDAEVTQFSQARDINLNAVPLYREADPVVGSALVFKFLGARLAADFLASGGNGPRAMVLDDASKWPTAFPFRFFVSRVPLTTFPERKKTFFECTARTGNTLTVTYVPVGGSEFENGATFQDRFIGDAAGSECQNYVRLFSAMTGADNGKGSNDPAASGTLPVRSRIIGNPNYPPQGPSNFGYGWCAHVDYVNDSRFNPWVPGYQGTGLGDGVSRANIIDTSEIFIQLRAWIDWNTTLPDLQGGKWLSVQGEVTNPQQITAGLGSGGGAFAIPSTPAAPFSLAKFDPNTFGSAGQKITTDPYVKNNGNYQPGSYDPVTGKSWAATSVDAVSGQPSVGQDTPDGSTAWEHKYGRWVTFQWRLRPGKNWHHSVPLKNAWDSASQSTLTLLDAPDEWPTSGFQILSEADPDLGIASSVFNVATRSGAVLSGVTLASGPAVVSPAFGDRWIRKQPQTPAGATALNTLVEVKFADFGDTQYTTLLSVSDHPIVYGSRGQNAQFFDDSIPGFSAFWLWGYRNTELGGATAPHTAYFQKFAQLIISKSEIPVPSGEIPTWVPPAGEFTTLTVANGKLTNNFNAVVSPFYDPFYSIKIVNDFSGATKNPYWGQYGATMFFGGGHSGTNDNSVIALEYGPTACTFKRVCDPTNWFPADPSLNNITTGGAMAALVNFTYMESIADGKPLSPHSYGSNDIIGPEYGGAACGTLLNVVQGAAGFPGYNGLSPHELQMADTTTSSAVRAWSRVSNDSIPHDAGASWAVPVLTAFVGPQNRTYIQANSSVGNVRWYDRTTAGPIVTGSGTTFGFDSADGFDSGIMFYVPTRGLLVCMYPSGGQLVVQWMDVTVAQPTLGGTATLSQSIAVENPWSAAAWCPHNNRIIVGKYGASGVYEITIPAVPANTWPVEFAAFTGLIPFEEPKVQNPDSNGITYKKWHYDERVRCIVYMPMASVGNDIVYAYRPRNT